MKFGVPMTVPPRASGHRHGPSKVAGLGRLLEDLRDAEVDQLDDVGQALDGLVAPREEDVVRLEVAMHDAGRVRLGQRARPLATESDPPPAPARARGR